MDIRLEDKTVAAGLSYIGRCEVKVSLADEGIYRFTANGVTSNPIRITTAPRGPYWGDIHFHNYPSVDAMGNTPYEYARDDLLPALSNGKQVILSEFGHTNDIWNFQPEATVRLLTAYFDDGVVDDSLFTYQPMDFDAGQDLRGMAKTGLGIIAGGIAAIVGLSVWLILR